MLLRQRDSTENVFELKLEITTADDINPVHTVPKFLSIEYSLRRYIILEYIYREKCVNIICLLKHLKILAEKYLITSLLTLYVNYFYCLFI